MRRGGEGGPWERVREGQHLYFFSPNDDQYLKIFIAKCIYYF